MREGRESVNPIVAPAAAPLQLRLARTRASLRILSPDGARNYAATLFRAFRTGAFSTTAAACRSSSGLR